MVGGLLSSTLTVCELLSVRGEHATLRRYDRALQAAKANHQHYVEGNTNLSGR